MLRQIHSQVGLVEFDNAGQVISIDVNDEEIDSASSWGNIAPIAKSKTKTSFKPTLTALGEKMRGFISASMIAMKAKSFDDGLYAAIDLMAHEGVSTFAGKRELIQLVLARALANDPLDRSDGLQVLACAALSSGSAISLPNDLRSIIEEHLAQFETSFLSKPLGFYSWTQELSQLFKHDRLLQTKCLDNNFLSLISVLKTDENLKQRYLAYLNLISRLTNPLTNCGLATAVSSPEWAPTDEKVAFFPASNSHELELYKKIQAEVESGKTSLIEELLKGVKSGEIQLTPTSESGWYDWQLYALEPLAIVDKMPEAKHLVPSEKY
ncbi:MAG: hypothetical protein K8F91_00005, partial [Candidatus Obscuribacterales bacterium]|nr:hypothetical protein [Candidatus Obscuribacterales bacterium]